MRKFNVFGIDLQNAFTQTGHALCVPGAVQDTAKTSVIISSYAQYIEKIVLTMDTHDVDHIGHPGYWLNAEGVAPDPFTLVTAEALETGALRPKDESKTEHVKKYIAAIGPAMIWPEHCVPGTESHALNDLVVAAIAVWTRRTGRSPVIVQKGYQKNTESFGVFAAEFDDGDFGADFNTHLMATLMHGNLPLVVVGEALSHCVKRSVEQLMEYLDDAFGAGNWPIKVILLRDCTSPVPGFEDAAAQFVVDAAARGVVVAESTDLHKLLS